MNGYDVIAIDGPAASGKSSVAKAVALKLGIPYINTGNMYRAVTFAAQSAGISLNPPDIAALKHLLTKTTLDYCEVAQGSFELFLNGTRCGAEIRTPVVTAEVSAVAAVPEIRNWLTERQRGLAEKMSLVMEGRDIGTVVFPSAAYKFFLTASPLVRAQRRLAQSGETPDHATVESVAAMITERDFMDSNRAVSPLRQAENAIFLDNSGLTLHETIQLVLSKIKNTALTFE